MTLKRLSKHRFLGLLNWLDCMIVRTELKEMDIRVTCFSVKTNLIYIEDTRLFLLYFLQLTNADLHINYIFNN